MKYTIYQLPPNSPKAFRGSLIDEVNPDMGDYVATYRGEEPDDESHYLFLETLFHKFNVDRPDNFAGHSMSVSDVIVLELEDSYEFWFCDDHGWKQFKVIKIK